jgi:hypothetical protein
MMLLCRSRAFLFVASLLGLIGFVVETAVAGNNVVIVLDDSGSMRDRMRTSVGRIAKIDAAKQALSKVIASLPDDTQLGVLLLNGSKGSQNWLIPLGPLDKIQADQKIQSIRADGGTPLGTQVQTGMDELLKLRAKQIYGTYRLLIVTDGEATDGDRLKRVMPGLMSRGISVDVIGVDMANKHSLATQVHSYRRADDAASFEKAVSEILAESSSATDGSESDFDFLAGFPDVLAGPALEALSKPNNAAIGLDEQPMGQLPRASESAEVEPATVAAAPATQTTQRASGISGILSGLCCMAFMGVIFLLIIGTIVKNIRN